MSIYWVTQPIHCEGDVVCDAISPDELLLPFQHQIAFRAKLLFNAWEFYACEGRQMSLADFDNMEEFEVRLSETSLNEDSIRQLVDEFGDFLPAFLTNGKIDVPRNVLDSTQ